MAIIDDQQAPQLVQLIDEPQQAQRSFWTAKAFHGYISDPYQIQCSYETVVRFFHKQWRKIIRAFGSGYIGRYRQPWEDTTNHRYRNVILTNALNQTYLIDVKIYPFYLFLFYFIYTAFHNNVSNDGIAA